MEKSYLDSNDYGIKDDGYTESQAKKACIISLVLRYAYPVVICIAFGLSVVFSSKDTEGMQSIVTLFELPLILIFVTYVISWVLMIKVRLRRSDYRFGKILMLLYIGDTVLGILVFIIQLTIYFAKSGLV